MSWRTASRQAPLTFLACLLASGLAALLKTGTVLSSCWSSWGCHIRMRRRLHVHQTFHGYQSPSAGQSAVILHCCHLSHSSVDNCCAKSSAALKLQQSEHGSLLTCRLLSSHVQHASKTPRSSDVYIEGIPHHTALPNAGCWLQHGLQGHQSEVQA